MQEKTDNSPPPLPPKKFITSKTSVRYEQPNVHEPHSMHTKQQDNPPLNSTVSPPGSIRSKNPVRYKQPTVVNETNPTLTKQPDNPLFNPIASPPGSIRSKYLVGYKQPVVNEQNPTLTKQPDNPVLNSIASPPGSIRSKNLVRHEQPTVNEQNPTLTKQPGQDHSEGHTENVIFNSALVKCDKCQSDVIPDMEYKIGCCAVSLCITTFLFGPIGLCVIPLIYDSFKDKHYKCTNCNHTLYVENRCCMPCQRN